MKIYFAAGMLAYLAHWAVEHIGLPIKVGEFALLAIVVDSARFGVIRRNMYFCGVAIYLCFFLGAWGVTADAVAEEGWPSPLKTAFRMPLYYTIIALFLILSDRRRPLYFSAGLFAGHVCYFLLVFPLTLLNFPTGYSAAENVSYADVEQGTNVLLKWVVPNPVIAPCILLLCGKSMGTSQRGFWVFTTLTTLSATIYVESRTTIATVFLATVIMAVFWICRQSKSLRSEIILPIFCGSVSIIPFVVAFFITASDVFNSDFNSWSNVERIFMLNVCWEAIERSPLLGTGSTSFWALYGPHFEEAFGFPAVVTSPHNLFAEASVSWGVPAGLIVLVLNALFTALAVQKASNSTLTALALAALTIAYAVLPLADMGRLSSIILWFCALSRHQQQVLLAGQRVKE